MKISKTAVLIGGFLTTGLGLTMGAPIDLYKDPSYAVQHISGVKIIESGNAVSSTVKHTENLVNIETDNFILSKDKDSNKIITGIYSSILGGSGNTITGDYSVIVGGENNKIEGGVGDSILGGLENKLKTGENSVIIGGENNVLEGNNSSIVGGTGNTVNGDYSVVVGNNSHLTGSYSVVMGQNSNLNANSSFLWTDGNHADTFTTDNVFAVIASGGMVINATRPRNDHTQLTLGGPLVLSENTGENDSIICSGGKGGGIVKVVNSGDKVCMCSCDGYERSSLFGLGTCRSVCNPDIKPKCGTGISKHWDATGQYNYYSGGCDSGNVVNGAYFVDKYNVIHWSCQSDDGAVLECTGSDIMGGGYEGCGGIKPTGEHIERGPSTGVSNNSRKQWEYVDSEPQRCQWSCEDGYKRNGTKNECKRIEYQCRGIYPKSAFKTGSSIYYNKNYTPKEWTPVTNWSSISSLDACYFACNIGSTYVKMYGDCVRNPSYECIGTLPDNAVMNNTVNNPRNLKEAQLKHDPGSSKPCTFHCESGYKYDGVSKKCIKIESEMYDCAEPLPPLNSTVGASQYESGYAITQWEYAGLRPLAACLWTCSPGYKYDNGKCVKNDPDPDPVTTTGSCTGTLSPLAELWNNDSPSEGTVKYFHSTGTTTEPCAYHCAAPSKYDGNIDDCITELTNPCSKENIYTCDIGKAINQSGTYNNNMITFTWDCESDEGTIRNCDHIDRDIDCKHCAKNGFDYCFPIDFSEDCNEVTWWENDQLDN